MKYTIAIIGMYVATQLHEQGHPWIALGVVVVVFWELLIEDWWRTFRDRWGRVWANAKEDLDTSGMLGKAGINLLLPLVVLLTLFGHDEAASKDKE